MTAVPEDYVYDDRDDTSDDIKADFAIRRGGTCCECGFGNGNHATGCPEAPDVDEDEDEVEEDHPCENCSNTATQTTEDGIHLCDACFELCPEDES